MYKFRIHIEIDMFSTEYLVLTCSNIEVHPRLRRIILVVAYFMFKKGDTSNILNQRQNLVEIKMSFQY